MADPNVQTPPQANTNSGDSTQTPASNTPSPTPPAATPPVGAPENYSVFTMPNGFALSEGNNSKIAAFGKKYNLTQEAAQELVNFGVDFSKEIAEMHKTKSSADFALKREGWVESIKADKDFGGEKFSETANRARRAVKAFGDPELIKFLEDEGYGDHPALVRAFARIDRKINAEASFIEGGSPNSNNSNAADVLFGDMFKK